MKQTTLYLLYYKDDAVSAWVTSMRKVNAQKEWYIEHYGANENDFKVKQTLY